MDRQHEDAALGEVRQRLASRFPQLDSEVVEAAVRVAYSKLSGPIREFVPVLVEHAAREHLNELTREETQARARSGAVPAR
jgi:hypothetical protein